MVRHAQFLGLLGGVIAFFALRKRDRRTAYKNLGVGVGITMILPALVLVAYMAEGGSFTDVIVEEVASCDHPGMDQSDIYESETVRYEGEIVR